MSHISSKNFAIYAIKDLVLMMIMKSIIKSEITSLHRKTEELLIIFVI